MAFNYAKLRGKIKECGITQKALAEKIGSDSSTISAKLNNKYSFSMNEIDAICKVLDIPKDEIGAYFFTHKVQKS